MQKFGFVKAMDLKFAQQEPYHTFKGFEISDFILLEHQAMILQNCKGVYLWKTPFCKSVHLWTM